MESQPKKEEQTEFEFVKDLELRPAAENMEIRKFADLRGLDLSSKDLGFVASGILEMADFDSLTRWPEKERLPFDFDPEKFLEESKDPGLGIRKLHKEGVDGKGICVAIIDQNLLDGHDEYNHSLFDYSELGPAKGLGPQMHGPAVASLLVGKNCGVAPGAKLFYRAVTACANLDDYEEGSGERTFEWYVKSLSEILELNKVKKEEEKIRIVSCSIGYMKERPEEYLEEWDALIQEAYKEGVTVIDVGGLGRLLGEEEGSAIGGGTSHGKDNADNYEIALWLDEDVKSFLGKERIVVPSDYRTMASWKGSSEYVYNGCGGMSWATPYLAGIFALALQLNPDLTGKEIAKIINDTVTRNKKGFVVINPRGVIEYVRENKKN